MGPATQRQLLCETKPAGQTLAHLCCMLFGWCIQIEPLAGGPMGLMGTKIN